MAAVPLPLGDGVGLLPPGLLLLLLLLFLFLFLFLLQEQCSCSPASNNYDLIKSHKIRACSY